MDRTRFNYSMKNIPIPKKNNYIKILIEKVENVVKRMRWKAFFFDKDTDQDNESTDSNNYGFKSRKCPPQNEEMDKFQTDLLEMVRSIEFRNVKDKFQDKLNEDINRINKSSKAFIPAVKTSNFYELNKEQHEKLLRDSITTTYKKADESSTRKIDLEAKRIATELGIADKTERIAKQQAFITLKDHKENFSNNPTCRLINPAKTELGHVSKKILDDINTSIRQKTSLNQWKSTSAVTDWFNNIQDKSRHSFVVFDIDSFYPSISEKLLLDAVNYAKNYTTVTDHQIDIIMHCRKSLLFDNDAPWVKRNNEHFDISMGSHDGAEVCELVGLFLLDDLSNKYGQDSVGLYRDDGLAVFKDLSGPQSERTKKDIIRRFKNRGLKITIQANLKIADFLDVTLNLTNGTYYPYRKPNNETVYINTKSNHPPSILKSLPVAINRRISDISCNEEVFNRNKQHYEDALKRSGHNVALRYADNSDHTNSSTQRTHRSRKRNIIWFNPPFSKNVKTNVGKIFLGLIKKHFPKDHRYHKIFNKNTVKVSYSCMDNMERIIKQHNNKVLSTPAARPNSGCNCRKKDQCPLSNNCLTPSLIYRAHVKTDTDSTGKSYIGLTEGPFKQRYNNHTLSFRDRKRENSTELSKYVWKLKDEHTSYKIHWTILAKAAAYNNKTKRCNLCLTEKLHIIRADTSTLLNKRSELISKCRHENKFLLKNLS